MKAAVFDYQRPDSVDAALALAADTSIESVFIAGGQSLVPMMATRLATPARLIDIGRLETLAAVQLHGDRVRIGSTTTQRDALADAVLRREVPLLTKAISHVGHQQTRNRGTIGGSVCHADPVAEIALVAVVLDAKFALKSTGTTRTLAAKDFFQGPLMTARAAEECLIAIEFPRAMTAPAQRVGSAFVEVSARAGDFAIVSAAADVTLDEAGHCVRIACGVGGAAPTPVYAEETCAALVGTSLPTPDIKQAAALITSRLQPTDDLRASAEYRGRVAVELLARCIADARDATMNPR